MGAAPSGLARGLRGQGPWRRRRGCFAASPTALADGRARRRRPTPVITQLLRPRQPEVIEEGDDETAKRIAEIVRLSEYQRTAPGVLEARHAVSLESQCFEMPGDDVP